MSKRKKTSINEESSNEIKELFQKLFITEINEKLDDISNKLGDHDRKLDDFSKSVNESKKESEQKLDDLSGNINKYLNEDDEEESLPNKIKQICDAFSELNNILRNIDNSSKEIQENIKGLSSKDDNSMSKQIEGIGADINIILNSKCKKYDEIVESQKDIREELKNIIGSIDEYSGQLTRINEEISDICENNSNLYSQLDDYSDAIKEINQKLHEVLSLQESLEKEQKSFSELYDNIDKKINDSQTALIGENRKYMIGFWIANGALILSNLLIILKMFF